MGTVSGANMFVLGDKGGPSDNGNRYPGAVFDAGIQKLQLPSVSVGSSVSVGFKVDKICPSLGGVGYSQHRVKHEEVSGIKQLYGLLFPLWGDLLPLDDECRKHAVGLGLGMASRGVDALSRGDIQWQLSVG